MQTLEFIAANGERFDLNAGAFRVAREVAGRFMPSVGLVTRELPAIAGRELHEARITGRSVSVPLIVTDDSPKAVRDAMRSLVKAANPTLGDCILRSVAEDGRATRLTCRYEGGLKVTEAGWWQSHQKAVLKLFAADPFWYDETKSTQTFTLGEAATFFPIFPLSLTSTTIFSSSTVTNDGDVEAWPTFTIHGPGVDPVLLNATTGERLELDAVSIAKGETVVINTEPGVKTVERGSGENLYPNLTNDSTLWPFVGGDNKIEVQMADATSDSKVVSTHKRRWLSP